MNDPHESGAEAFGGLQGRSFAPRYETPLSSRVRELESKIKFWAAELRIIVARAEQLNLMKPKVERMAREMLKEVGAEVEEIHARPR